MRAFAGKCGAALRAEAVAALVVVPALCADPAEDEQPPLPWQETRARPAMLAEVLIRMLRVPHQFDAAAVRAGECDRLCSLHSW